MFIIFAFLLSFPTFASPDPGDLSLNPNWLRLLHYKKNLTGGYESQADGMGFFLHPKGKRNPELELKRSIELFGATSSPQNGDAACKFPARAKWLNEALGRPWKIDLSGCQTYLSFFAKVAAKRASIVFSSYYLGNPNSAFGHTFLRLSRYDDRSETEMLDYGINFAAESKGSNPFTYAFKGLFGGFPGRFTALPYYYKVREYSDYEFRDLWSYELKLDLKQVLEMVDHIWELGHTDFDYYYFQENCSYHLLSVLEVVLPEKELTSNYSLFAIPADTIRLLKQEGLIGEGKRRESTYSRLTRLSEKLTASSLETAHEMVKEPRKTQALVQGVDVQKAADTLDVAIEAFDYYNSEKILKDDPKTMEAKANILRERAQNPVITRDVEAKSLLEDSPAEGHAPTRYTLAQGYRHGFGKETFFQSRAALHDLLDPPRGSLKEGQIEMAKVSFNYLERNYKDPKLRLQDLTVLSIKNFPPQSFWASPFSWEIELGSRQLDLLSCFDCPTGMLMGSVGNSLQLADRRVLMAFLLNGEFNLQGHYEHGYQAALGPKLISRLILNEKWMMGVEARYHLNTRRMDEFMEDHLTTALFELRHHYRQDLSFFISLKGLERSGQWANQGLLGLQYFH